jgi:hypothetical protein
MKPNANVTLPEDFSIQRTVQSRAGQVQRIEAARKRAEEIRGRIEQGGHADLIALYRRDLGAAEQNEREATAAIERLDALIAAYQQKAA